MDVQKLATYGTAVAVVGAGSVVGGGSVIDNMQGGPEKRIEAEKKLNKLLDELTELNASWEKYNETRNKIKKRKNKFY